MPLASTVIDPELISPAPLSALFGKSFTAQFAGLKNLDKSFHIALDGAALEHSNIGVTAERELRYLIHIDQLKDLIGKYDSGYGQIIQHQFNSEEKAALEDSLPAKVSKKMFQDINAKSARIRQTIIDGKNTFELQTKSPRCPQFNAERIEAELEISKELFGKLSALATKGSMVKQRIIMKGEVKLAAGSTAPLELHIDRILAAGRRNCYGHIPNAPVFASEFLIVEVEFFDRSHLKPVIQGNHSFKNLLSECQLISGDSFLSRVFSTSKIARNGFMPESFQAMHEYLAERKSLIK